MRDSTTIEFLKILTKNRVNNIYGYDKKISDLELESEGVTPCSIEEGFEGADAVFIMNNNDSYADLPILSLSSTMNKPALFFDGWQIFSPNDIRTISGIVYAGVGVG